MKYKVDWEFGQKLKNKITGKEGVVSKINEEDNMVTIKTDSHTETSAQASLALVWEKK